MRLTGTRKALCFVLMLAVTVMMTPAAWAAAGQDYKLQAQLLDEEKCAGQTTGGDNFEIVANDDPSMDALQGHHGDRDRHHRNRCEHIRKQCWHECRHHHHNHHRHNGCVERCLRHHRCHGHHG